MKDLEFGYHHILSHANLILAYKLLYCSSFTLCNELHLHYTLFMQI